MYISTSILAAKLYMLYMLGGDMFVRNFTVCHLDNIIKIFSDQITNSSL